MPVFCLSIRADDRGRQFGDSGLVIEKRADADGCQRLFQLRQGDRSRPRRQPLYRRKPRKERVRTIFGQDIELRNRVSQ